MTKNWKKILPTCLSYFLEHVPLSEGTGKGGSTCQPKSFNFPLIAFRQILAKTLRAACIQLDHYDLLEEAWLNLSPLIQNSVQQDYLPESYTRYLLSYQKCQKLLHPSGVDCSPPFRWTFMGDSGDGGKSYPAAKSLLISPVRKIPLNRFKSFAIKSFITSPLSSNYQVITLCNLHLLLSVISVVPYFKFQALCTHMSF